MASNQSQVRLLIVKNTFIDSVEDSDLSAETVMQRSRSEPTMMLSSAAESSEVMAYRASFLEPVPGLNTQRDQRSVNLVKGAAEAQKLPLEETDMLVSASVNSMSTTDSRHGSTVDFVDSWADLESEFANDAEGNSLAANDELRHSPPKHFCGKNSMSMNASSTLQGWGSASHMSVKRKISNSNYRTCPEGKTSHPNQPSAEVSSSPVTTLMLCNLPCRLSQEGLAQAADRLGFEGKYDLVYIPRGYQNFIGYGFINFVTPEDATCFCRTISAVTFSTRETKKKVSVVVAKDQGLAKNLESIRKGGNFRKRSHAPLLFCRVD